MISISIGDAEMVKEFLCTTGEDGGRVTMPPGATDAFLTEWHIDKV